MSRPIFFPCELTRTPSRTRATNFRRVQSIRYRKRTFRLLSFLDFRPNAKTSWTKERFRDIYIRVYIRIGTYVYVCNVYEKGKLRENERGRRIKLQADTLGKFSNPTAIDCIPFAAHIDLLFPLSFSFPLVFSVFLSLSFLPSTLFLRLQFFPRWSAFLPYTDYLFINCLAVYSNELMRTLAEKNSVCVFLNFLRWLRDTIDPPRCSLRKYFL